jgi:hypothetical protein
MRVMNKAVAHAFLGQGAGLEKVRVVTHLKGVAFYSTIRTVVPKARILWTATNVCSTMASGK